METPLGYYAPSSRCCWPGGEGCQMSKGWLETVSPCLEGTLTIHGEKDATVGPRGEELWLLYNNSHSWKITVKIINDCLTMKM